MDTEHRTHTRRTRTPLTRGVTPTRGGPCYTLASPERGRASTLLTGPPNRYAQFQGPNGYYNQWTPSFPAYTLRDPASSQAPQSPTVQTSSQLSYAPPPPPLSSTSGPSYSHPSYSYTPPVKQEPHPQITSPSVLPVFSPPLQPSPPVRKHRRVINPSLSYRRSPNPSLGQPGWSRRSRRGTRSEECATTP